MQERDAGTPISDLLTIDLKQQTELTATLHSLESRLKVAQEDLEREVADHNVSRIRHRSEKERWTTESGIASTVPSNRR